MQKVVEKLHSKKQEKEHEAWRWRLEEAVYINSI